MTGKELAKSLATYLQGANWMVWTDQPLGSVQLDNARRADVLAISKSYTKPFSKIFEVKISKGDFLRDVNNGKYQHYFPFCHQLYFA